MQRIHSLVLVITLCLTSLVVAQTNSDLTVTGVDFDNPRWGRQQLAVHLTNNTPDLKFATIITEVDFPESDLRSNRRVRTSFMVPPEERMILRPLIMIPGDYGQARVTIKYYDVVDTLDQVFEFQRFRTDTMTVAFDAPEEVKPYLEQSITLPPRVADHPFFDHTMARLLLLLLSEGKAVSDIARITGASEEYILDILRVMTRNEFVTETAAGYKTNFTVISNREAREGAALAEAVADTLAQIIAANLPAYHDKIAAMAAAGEITADSNLFLDAGSVLYYEYPVIGGLLLWTHLGRAFITRSAPLLIYDGTDLCNAKIPNYMYLTHGGEDVNGHHFFAQFISSKHYAIYFGDQPMPIVCGEDFLRRAEMGQPVRWSLPEDFELESFMVDTMVAAEPLQVLAGDADSLLWRTYIKLRDKAVEFGHERLDYAQRYWFWNLVATRTLDNLVTEGVVSRRGNGQFRFNGM